MIEQSQLDTLKQKLQFGGITGKTIKFVIDEDQFIFVDTTESPMTIEEGRDDDADVTLKASKDTFVGILNGTQDPNMAFMTGKLKVQGSMGFAMKLAAVLED
tara:strand:+ start:77 stop:382 length:306 start_codon:yes stop_codon:yes gene_type:complete